MSRFTKMCFVFLLVSSLVIAQGDLLLAQSKVTESVVVSSLPQSTAKAASPKPSDAASRALPSAPQASSKSRFPEQTGLVVGVALSGLGAALLAKKEPVHQTVCITYDACPVPGIIHITGGLMLGVGVPLTIFKLVKH